MKKSLNYFLILFSLALFSCEKEDPEVPNEEELITTVIYTLTPQTGGSSPVVLSFKDLDGDGGQAPTIVGGTLRTGVKYNGKLQFLDDTKSPAENITAEVLEEADEHQVFFQTSSTLNLTVTYEDADKDGKPLGLSTLLAANTRSTGSLKIILKHEPNKAGMNVDKGDISNAGGETDIEVSFNITIE